MNTEKYIEMFKNELDAGDIPQDLYDLLVKEIEVDGKMTKRVYSIYLEELERRRLFYVEGTPFNTKNSAKTDGTYVYLHTKNPLWYIAHGFWSTIYKLLGFIGSRIGYGVWSVPDRKKLKGLRSFITVSNHMGYIDTVLTRRAVGARKQYVVAAPHNCKNNLGGAILRAAAVLPTPIAFRGVKPFGEALRYVRDKGATIHFYAEQSMWVHYKKPRPYKDGAFHYAERLNVPVVPVFYCLKEPKGLRKLLGMPKAVIKIADPVFPNLDLPSHERKLDLAKRVEEATKKLYEDFYGIPLEYLPEKKSEPSPAAEPDGKASE